MYRSSEDDPEKPVWALPGRRTIGSQVTRGFVWEEGMGGGGGGGRSAAADVVAEAGSGGAGVVLTSFCWFSNLQRFAGRQAGWLAGSLDLVFVFAVGTDPLYGCCYYCIYCISFFSFR